MTTSDWIADRAAEITQALGPLGRPDEPYAFLDWPNHSNVGDSAIWLGEIVWARQCLRRMPVYVSASGKPADGLDRQCPEGVVFLHGGGNFGDLWTHINDRRIELLESHRHRRIVQLPQSIHFDSQSELDRMQRAIAGHPDFTLLVRDTASLAFARAHFDCETRLCPDMALMLGALPRPIAPEVDVFCLMRTDKERALPGEIEAPGPVEDWLDEPQMPTLPGRLCNKITNRALRHGAPRLVVRPLMAQCLALMNRQAEARLQRGLRMLARGERVLTDRLHAHILCTLMGIPHVVLDNSYAKLGNFINTWPADGMTQLADTVEAARAMITTDRG